MRLTEQFTVDEERSVVWRFFEQPDRVARCVPGVERIDVLDADNVQVQITQRVGPMSATFDAKVKVLDRVPEELIRFEAVGRSVRGANGNMRAVNVVRLEKACQGTAVTVEGSLTLAGTVGSLGQKVVAKQASRVTADFAQNLQAALSGAPSDRALANGGPPTSLAPQRGGAVTAAARNPRITAGVIAAALAAVAAVILLRRLRGDR